MNKFLNGINNFLKARTWSGGAWLFTLCLLLAVSAGTYILSHRNTPGQQYVQLDKRQLLMVKKCLDNSPDSVQARKARTGLIMLFLDTEFNNKLIGKQRKAMDSLLNLFNNAQVYDYLTEKKILAESTFWLTGNSVYMETLFWSLLGVLVSLIYYVSLANAQSSNTAGDDDCGSFDPTEISGQVAKMFFAPACTLILILGYHYVLSDGSSMADINIGNGVIVFSFISGFFSGRVMKFLDRMKELLLPVTGTKKTGNPPPNDNTGGNNGNSGSVPLNNVVVQVTLDVPPGSIADADAALVESAGFNAAVVTLTSVDKQEVFDLIPNETKNGLFERTGMLPGKYILTASVNYKRQDEAMLTLYGSKEIELVPDITASTLVLEQV
ncbi:hypothetical protein [Sediminibacterium ginsengisoli]|uniref:Uncharacterized protein n=1 Tax=Sediminibacterium ginsengisoli TaxID=413434 RepID=A0A1T4RKR5_9BACT|nr:hypothetical protein [Sediminibacterium ginsengisoli]SKA16584.1 hypothetical protein SAMN04488132_11330 [Sediminibacterium ginsengisoli]